MNSDVFGSKNDNSQKKMTSDYLDNTVKSRSPRSNTIPSRAEALLSSAPIFPCHESIIAERSASRMGSGDRGVIRDKGPTRVLQSSKGSPILSVPSPPCIHKHLPGGNRSNVRCRICNRLLKAQRSRITGFCAKCISPRLRTKKESGGVQGVRTYCAYVRIDREIDRLPSEKRERERKEKNHV